MGIRAVASLLVAAVALIAGGYLLGAYFQTPQEASLRQPPVVVPVTDNLRTEVLERTMTVRGQLAPTERTTPRFAAGTEGRIITAIGANPGEELIPGSLLVEVEGRPVIALTGAFPTWRDFSMSMTPGPDVAQLQAALAELGLYREEIDGHFGPKSRSAVMRLFRSVGYQPLAGGTIQHDELVFVPASVAAIERVSAMIGDRLDADAFTFASATRRIEADLTVDQLMDIATGAEIRLASGSAEEAWSATIEEVMALDPALETPGSNSAILPRESVPPGIVGEQIFEVVLESTNGPVLSASPAAVHLDGEGESFVVVLDAGRERRVSVIVGVITDERVEVVPRVDGELDAGDALVLNPSTDE